MKQKYKMFSGYDLVVKILYKIVSNSHVVSDPLGAGIYVCSS